ncbi:hypothetical protein [Streptosporangium subroseum]|nr:hypothetical protein [Streptosporangium subroseum]
MVALSYPVGQIRIDQGPFVIGEVCARRLVGNANTMVTETFYRLQIRPVI